MSNHCRLEKNAQKRRDGTWAEIKSGRERESLRETDRGRERSRETQKGGREIAMHLDWDRKGERDKDAEKGRRQTDRKEERDGFHGPPLPKHDFPSRNGKGFPFPLKNSLPNVPLSLSSCCGSRHGQFSSVWLKVLHFPQAAGFHKYFTSWEKTFPLQWTVLESGRGDFKEISTSTISKSSLLPVPVNSSMQIGLPIQLASFVSPLNDLQLNLRLPIRRWNSDLPWGK